MEENIKETFVVDASIVLAFLLQEKNDQANKILKKYRDEEIHLISPMLLKFEVGNSLRTAILRKRISQIKAEALYNAFLELDIVEEKIDHIKVLKLALSKKISFYDASYLYLALSNHIRLLTLDNSLK